MAQFILVEVVDWPDSRPQLINVDYISCMYPASHNNEMTIIRVNDKSLTVKGKFTMFMLLDKIEYTTVDKR